MTIAKRKSSLKSLLREYYEIQAFPSAVCGVFIDGAKFFLSMGKTEMEKGFEPDENSLFDIASLTKIVATSTLFLHLFKENKLSPEDKLNTCSAEKSKIRIIDLLEHRAGFCSFIPLYKTAKNREDLKIKAKESELCYTPNKRVVYSDVGYIVLCDFIETKFEKRFDNICYDLFNNIGFTNTLFIDKIKSMGIEKRVVPTSTTSSLRVHDENANFMDGVSTHAGLFSTASELINFSKKILEKKDFCEILFHQLKSTEDLQKRRFIYGFDTFIRDNKKLIGHLGYTGCAIWIDFESNTSCVLLTNRVWPSEGREPKETPETFRNFREKIIKVVFD